ncbi:universal stress protein [Streptomyces sp. NPDC002851]
MSNASTSTTAPVLVAVDGSDPSLRALRWARDTARLRGTDVLAAHVRPGRGGGTGEAGRPDPVGQQIETVRGEVADDGPKVRFMAVRGVQGGPSVRLCELAERDGLLVLGSRGLGGFAALLLGSNGRRCATHAPGPVVVVPHASRAVDAAPPPGRERHGRVVLGLDPEETPDEAIAFAFAEAARRRAELQVISTYRVPFSALTVVGEFGPGHGPGHGDVPGGLVLTAGQRSRLAPYAEHHPQVTVDPVVTPADPCGRLVTASTRADLVVVGRHRRRLRADALPLGSVTNAVLTHAHAPVAVIPAG